MNKKEKRKEKAKMSYFHAMRSPVAEHAAHHPWTELTIKCCLPICTIPKLKDPQLGRDSHFQMHQIVNNPMQLTTKLKHQGKNRF